MGKPRKFCGITYTSEKKCKNCPPKDDCLKGDKTHTAKEILIDCEAFYYVYKKIEEFEMYPRFDGDIEKHRRDMIEYEEKHKGIPMLTPPLITNGTLAAELALKFLVFREKGEYECGHHLQFLFNQLSEPHKSILTDKIFKEAHQNEITFAYNLKNISNLFEDYRYFYEHEILGYSNFLSDFIHIVCDYAISLKVEDEEN